MGDMTSTKLAAGTLAADRLTADLLAQEFRGAEERGELELHFQPEVDLASGGVTGMEALLRWAHPARGLLWPRDILPAARRAGLLAELGRWTLAACAAEVRGWPAGTRCWINVSETELADPHLALHVASVVAASGLPEGALGVDLREGALHAAGPDAAPLCAALRSAGVAVAVDDVGSAPSACLRLEGLAVDVVKLGRPLVRDVDTDPFRRADVSAVVREATRSGRTVVAEGVESWPEAACLRELGVTRAHGFLFSPPQRGDRARWLLHNPTAWRGSYLGDDARWGAGRASGTAVHDALADRPGTTSVRRGLSPHPAYGEAAGVVPHVAGPLAAPAPAAPPLPVRTPTVAPAIVLTPRPRRMLA